MLRFCWTIPYGVLDLSAFYLVMSTLVEIFAPTCLLQDGDECVSNGVNGSTNTVVMGFFVSFSMMVLAHQLCFEKASRYYMVNAKDQDGSPKHKKPKRNPKLHDIRASGIVAQLLLALGVLMDSFARLFQPNLAIGGKTYWSLTAFSVLLSSFGMYFHGRFVMETIESNFRICLRLQPLSFATFLVIWTAFVNFGARLACINKAAEAQVIAEDPNSNSNGRVLGNSMVNSMAFEPYEYENQCQSLAFYANYIYNISCFLFWVAAALYLRQGLKKKKEELQQINVDVDSEFQVLGLSTRTAIFGVPFVSITVAQLYPLWVMIASQTTGKSFMEVSYKSYEVVVYQYGLLVIALLSHNWMLKLTINPYEEHENYFAGDVFHDVTLGIFEDKKRDELKPGESTGSSDEEDADVERNNSESAGNLRLSMSSGSSEYENGDSQATSTT